MGYVHQLRYAYRRIILGFIPVRAYLIETSLSVSAVQERLQSLIAHDPLYFLRTIPSAKPYSGRMDGFRFTAIRKGKKPWERRMKVRGKIHPPAPGGDGKTRIGLMMSTPLSPFNFLFLGVVYVFFLWLYPTPFQWWPADVMLWLSPLLVGALWTSFSFKHIYRKEKLLFFKQLEATRIPDSQARNSKYL